MYSEIKKDVKTSNSKMLFTYCRLYKGNFVIINSISHILEDAHTGCRTEKHDDLSKKATLEMNGQVYEQVDVILHEVGKAFGFFPTDSKQRYQADLLVDLVEEFYRPMREIRYTKGSSENYQ
jgi:hypothetical protein